VQADDRATLDPMKQKVQYSPVPVGWSGARGTPKVLGGTQLSYDHAAELAEGGGFDTLRQAMLEQSIEGRRTPIPFDRTSHDLVPARPVPYSYADKHAPHAVYPAQSIRGRRRTLEGVYGLQAELDRQVDIDAHWDARHRVGYAPLGARGAGTSMEWDYSNAEFRYAGLLTATGATMNQAVPTGRPYLRINGDVNDRARVQVIGRMKGGAETNRVFMVGGGFTATFNMGDYSAAVVRLLFLDPTSANIQWAWLSNAIQAGDQALYMGARVAGAVQIFIPQGAYEVTIQNPDPNWVWNNDVIDDPVPNQNIGITIPSNVPSMVLGIRATPSIANEIVWRIRPF